MVEDSGATEPGERASDARSERERVWAAKRAAVEVTSTHIEAMFTTAAVFQSPMGWSKAVAPRNLESKRVTCGVSTSGRASERGSSQYPHGIQLRHTGRVPVADGLVEGSGKVEPGERASDARSERERVRAAERAAVEVTNTHIEAMVCTKAVFQLPMGWLKRVA
jgi:hypothetical protein